VNDLFYPVFLSTVDSVSDFEFRFGGIGRLFGSSGLARLRKSHVLVVGIGGVGSWTAEALARSGVGTLTLIDLDEVCVSNVNRQLPALEGTIGKSKVDVMADRIRAIHPECRIISVLEFLTETTADRLLNTFQEAGGNYVVDAIDASANKCRLIAGCRSRELPMITCGAAGGRMDPTQVRISDLAQVTHDRLLSDVRRRLRREHGFSESEKTWGIPAVHSPEAAVAQQADGSICVATEVRAEPGESPRLNCQKGYGSATFVTGVFGFVAAGQVVRQLAAGFGETIWQFSGVRRPISAAMKSAVKVETLAEEAG